jgi:hypothetical protein
MKYLVLASVFAAGFAAAHLAGAITAADQPPASPQQQQQQQASVPPPNPNIDMNGFLTGAAAAAKHRESRRLSEDDFLKTSKEEGVIVLDARSKEMYDLLHVKGAINLSFPDIDVVSLAKVLPDKKAKVLIYCNNNFTPAEPRPNGAGGRPAGPVAVKAAAAFRSKGPAASLNLSTYVTLHGYGYTNVYELAPTVDPDKTKLELVSNKK